MSIEQATVIDFLRRRGVIGEGDYQARELIGGVSGLVLAVDGPKDGFVVKSALPNLRAAEPWLSDPARTLTEARALRVAAMITPDRVPRVISVDEESMVLVIERAPLDTTNWRDLLLSESANPAIAAELGRTLGIWHRSTWLPWAGAADFASQEIFEQLRLRPFHGSVAERFPNLAEIVADQAELLRRESFCLVHGDFSHKNVLVGGDLLWVLDFEVAHVGHPIFDLAFMTSALQLTAVVRPGLAASLEIAWTALVDSYIAEVPATPDLDCLAMQTGCITLNRTDGISLDPYLDRRTRPIARRIGVRQLEGGRAALGSLWRSTDDLLG